MSSFVKQTISMKAGHLDLKIFLHFTTFLETVDYCKPYLLERRAVLNESVCPELDDSAIV